ncbi:MAG: prolyl oligopeptidase family serine peptidase [Rubrivivax sp.]|nr:prolyl oligopeptidase family serine peptidase [Rubrivivax sp.]
MGVQILVAATGASTVQAQTAAAEKLPAEAFYRDDDVQLAVLSPSGQRVALIMGQRGVRNRLLVADPRTPGAITQAAFFTDLDVEDVHWVNEERLVFTVRDRERRGVDGAEGLASVPPGLFSVRPDGSQLRTLIRLHGGAGSATGSRLAREQGLHWNHLLLHTGSGEGDEVVVGELVGESGGELRAVVPKRLDVVNGRETPVPFGPRGMTRSWLFDQRGEPRLAQSFAEGRSRLHWRAPGKDDWEEIAEFDYLHAPFIPHSIDSQGQLYVTAPEGAVGIQVLTQFDFKSRGPQAKPLVRADGFDFQGRLISEVQGGRALGVRVVTDAESTVWFDERLQALQAEVDKRFPGRVNRLSCQRCDGDAMVLLIYSYADRDPGRYFMVDVAAKRWIALGAVRRDIDPQRMALMNFDRIKARDGRDLPVWTTLPAGSAAAPRPAVLLVHGGPWVRGATWSWRPTAQFLASRGYVVIEPEFRGSNGYGAAHHRAGWREWGRAMQDDLADAVDWAVKKGLVDGKRVCIAGASYGGYATLMGLARHPELYRCGAAWVAVTEPRLMFESSWRNDLTAEARRFSLPEMVGDLERDPPAWWAVISPLAQAARIKAPVLLAFGDQDRRVPLVHGTKMRDALRAAGNVPEFVIYEDEGHGWDKLKTKVDFANRLEHFLAKHLK